MAACRACLTPHPRVPPARPDSSAACCWLLPRSVGGLGVSPRLASRSRMKGQSVRPDFPAFSSLISSAAKPLVRCVPDDDDPAALNPQSSALPGEDEGVF